MKNYLTSLSVVCILFSVMTAVVPDKKWKKIFDYVCSLVLILVAISPLVKIDLNDLNYNLNLIFSELVSENKGSIYDDEILCKIIKERSEEYILDKAVKMGMDISVQIILGKSDSYQIPESIQISGIYSDLEKEELSALISDDMGIPPEKQIWILER